jgi:hypothetical protein
VDETNPKAKHAPKADKRRVMLDPFAVAAIRLLIFTGARLREILDARWSHLDFERGAIFLPDSKTGKKPVYLSAAARIRRAIVGDIGRRSELCGVDRGHAQRANAVPIEVRAPHISGAAAKVKNRKVLVG